MLSHRLPSLQSLASHSGFKRIDCKTYLTRALTSSLSWSSSSSSSLPSRHLNYNVITDQHRCHYHTTSNTDLQNYPKNSLISSSSAWTGILNTSVTTNERRLYSTSTYRDAFLPNNIIQSPLPDIEIPDNIPMHQILFEKFDIFKDLPAVTDFMTGRSYTYTQLKDKSIRVASALAKKGYKKGDIILVHTPNQADFVVLMLASSCLGLQFSAANPGFTPEELSIQLNNSDSVAIFTHQLLVPVADMALKVEQYPNQIKDKFVFGQAEGYEPFQNLMEDDGKALPDVDLDPKSDVYILPYSSGTTGLPKGVMLSHYNIVANMLQTRESYKYDKGDNVLGLLPLYHIYGMSVIQFGSLYNGSHLHLLPKFEPETFLQCMQAKKIVTANLVPPLVLFMAKHPVVAKFDFSSLKSVVCGAAPLGKEITDAFSNRFNITPQQGYGLTETSPVTNIDFLVKPGSAGPLVCNTTAKFVDIETGESLGIDQEGELCVAGPQIMLGYYKNEKATSEMIDKDGWMRTGDIGYVDKEGSFYISDRLKELIKYKGSQVAPAELESLLIGHPEIADACVVGVPDDQAGELPKAFVVKNPGSDIKEDMIVKYIEDQVSHTKRLRGGVEFIDEIPKNPSGKILRKNLRNK